MLFDEDGNEIQPEGICAEYDTGCPFPTFSIVKPAIENTRVDMSPHGQSIFADAIDAVQAVDLAFDAMINEVDVSKMRVFLSGVLFDKERDGKKRISIPFGKQDCTVFRKVMSTEDTIQEFAPALRTTSQVEALRISLQMLGNLCGFGIDLPHEGAIRVTFDDSIIVDTYQEKRQDLAEVGVTMTVAEFRAKWYAESPEVAEEKAAELQAEISNA